MRISVYIPTKNRQALLSLAIDSVLAQDHPDVELLVVDDASTDGTWAYLQQLAATRPNVKVFRQTESKGACVARNLAIRAATGDFVTGLDDDDEFLPAHLSSLLACWQLLLKGADKPSCLYVQNWCRNGGHMQETFKPSGLSCHDLVNANHLGNQIFAPKDHYLSAGLFDEQMPAWQDLEFFYRVLKLHGRARLMDKPTYVFDVAPRPDRISVKSKLRILDAAARMTAKHSNGDPQFAQRLLLQVHADHYGFSVDMQDLQQFFKLGYWKQGWKAILRQYIRRTLLRRSATQAA
jgi:glycosyltransferase involved in cell wall biosynthesis